MHRVSLFIAITSFSITCAFGEPAKSPAVGMLLPLTGNYAAVGADNKQGIEAAQDILKSKAAINLVFADSKADPTTAVSEFRKLIDSDKVLAVYAMRGPVGMAVNPISQSSNISLLGGVGNYQFADTNKYAFQLWSKSDDEGAFLATRMATKGYKKIALLTAEDDWPSAVSKGFREKTDKHELELIYDQEILPSELDFRTVILQIKEKSPDAIFLNLALAQLGPFIKQMREQGVKLPIYSNFWIAKKDVVEAVGEEGLEGVRFVEMGTEFPIFKKTIETKFGSNPSGATLSAYVATILLQQAASELATNPSPADLYAALLKQKEVRTPDGNIEIVDRCVKFPLVERTMHNGKAETVKDE